MQPIGLTIKQTRKKYGPGRGELMLIHACTECNALSVNRIAADDDSQKVFAVFEGSYHIEGVILDDLGFYGIHLLGLGDSLFVRAQLFGNETDPAEICLQGCMMESTR